MGEFPRLPRPPLPEAHPAQLGAWARLAGRATPTVTGGRFGDLDATARQVLPLAAGDPRATWFAVPRDPSEAARLERGAQALGLDRVHVVDRLPPGLDQLVGDRALSRAADPTALLAEVAGLLVPDEVALLGWRALPGGHLLAMIADLVRLHRARRPELPPAAAARELIGFLAQNVTTSGSGAWIQAAHAAFSAMDDAELVETVLEPGHHPRYVDTVWAAAAAVGLAPLGDTRRAADGVSGLPEPAVDLLLDEQARFGPTRAALWLAFLHHQAYRLTVFGHAGREEAPQPLAGLWLAAPTAAAPWVDHPALHALRAASPRFLPFDDLPRDDPEATVGALLGAVERDAVWVRTAPPTDAEAEARAWVAAAEATAAP